MKNTNIFVPNMRFSNASGITISHRNDTWRQAQDYIDNNSITRAHFIPNMFNPSVVNTLVLSGETLPYGGASYIPALAILNPKAATIATTTLNPPAQNNTSSVNTLANQLPDNTIINNQGTVSQRANVSSQSIVPVKSNMKQIVSFSLLGLVVGVAGGYLLAKHFKKSPMLFSTVGGLALGAGTFALTKFVIYKPEQTSGFLGFGNKPHVNKYAVTVKCQDADTGAISYHKGGCPNSAR